MKKTFLILCAVLVWQTSLSAVLPPLYQGINELKDLLNEPKLGELLQSGEVIEEIKKVDNGYLIITNKHELLAEVVYQTNRRVGPAEYTIVLHQPVAK